jgi:predicted HicB family RNase H-like nuclease
MSDNHIPNNEAPEPDGDLTVTIRLSPERTREIVRLAAKEKSSLDDVAKQLLETEIEAQYGLIYGPFSRRHMYRV